MKYKKKLGTFLTEYNNQYYIIQDNKVFRVNESAARIFELCDNRDLYDISNKIKNFYNEDKVVVEKDIIMYLDELKNLGLIREIE